MSGYIEALGSETGEACFFTAGFLKSLYSAVTAQSDGEIKCIAAGDPSASGK